MNADAAYDPIAVTGLVTSALESVGIPYVITGSVASTVYGTARATMDVDILADMRGDQTGPLVEELGEAFLADEIPMREAVLRRASFNIIHLATMFKVDVFVAKDRAWDRERIARGRRTGLTPDGSVAADLASPEDVILAKLEWFRPGDEVSERQWRDVLGMLAVQGELLDFRYLRRWAAELSVGDLLERAPGESAAAQANGNEPAPKR